jgi:hypothetical protein
MSSNTTDSAPPNTTTTKAKANANAFDGQIERFLCSICLMGYFVSPGWPTKTCTRCGHKVCAQCISYTRLMDEVLGIECKEGEIIEGDNFSRP